MTHFLEKSPQFYFISDIHIGKENHFKRFDSQKELIDFLNFLENKAKERLIELIIVGDLFDLWEFNEKEESEKLKYIEKRYPLLIEKFRKASQKILITLIPGNHDHELVCFKKYSSVLKNWGISLIPNYYLRKNILGKLVRIEHGNRFDFFNKIKRFGDPNDTPLGFHITKGIVTGLAKITSENLERKKWFTNIRLVHPIDLIPYWFFSNYFYRELAPILRYLVATFLIFFTVSMIIFSMAIATRLNLINIPDIFYYTSHLGPVKYLANFIIVLSFVFLIIFLLFSFLWMIMKRDIFKSFLEYKINLKRDVKFEKISNCKKKIVTFFNKNPEYDIFIYGDNHTASLEKRDLQVGEKIIANTGTWIKLFRPIKSWFRLPSVYSSYFKLSYLVLEKEKGKIKMSLKHWPKKATQPLTFLERFSIMFKSREIIIKDKTLFLNNHD